MSSLGVPYTCPICGVSDSRIYWDDTECQFFYFDPEHVNEPVPVAHLSDGQVVAILFSESPSVADTIVRIHEH